MHGKAFKVYDETVREVTKAGSIPFVRELEQIYAGLMSPDSAIPCRREKMDRFLDVVQAIIEGPSTACADLASRTRKRAEEAMGVKTRHSQKSRHSDTRGPCGVSRNKSRSSINRLPSFGTPRMVPDDQRMKEINWAYESQGPQTVLTGDEMKPDEKKPSG